MTHKNGDPVDGAKLTLSGPVGDTEVFSDADGHYRFADLPPGQYDVQLFAESDPSPCDPTPPPYACLGPAVALEQRPTSVAAGQTATLDWVYPYDDAPSYAKTFAPSTTSTSSP